MRLFIIRPFGTKQEIDFDRVERELIQPAIERVVQLGYTLEGTTTASIIRQGNIREDMFRLILLSDLVIADVSIHNVNVFYELGIRHALRPQHTILIRSRTQDAYPFDLQTDRYFLYNVAAPGAGVADFADVIVATLNADKPDSPVFKLMPQLPAFRREDHLVEVPKSFVEEVEVAQSNGERGKLRLLVDEARGYEWDREGIRLAGEAQFRLRALNDARHTFETLLTAVPADLHANQRLATIYQRQAQSALAPRKAELLARSDQAIGRVLATERRTADRVEAYCLLASNHKSRWIAEFLGAPVDLRQAAALKSPYFKDMLSHYLKAANLDLNSHYPATNALALLRIQVALANTLPEVWRRNFDNAAKAEAALVNAQRLGDHLTSTLYLALELDEIIGKREGPSDPWASSSRADFMLLTSSDDPDRVEAAYESALHGANQFTLEAAQRNLQVYRDLGRFEPGVSAALNAVDRALGASRQGRPAPQKVILFTGHMIDAAGKSTNEQRFPRTEKAEAKARELIKAAVIDELRGDPATILGMAGGACGGDIVFHEVCEECGIETALYLALPEDQYKVESVQHGGAKWIVRYRTLIDSIQPHILQQRKRLPRWLADNSAYDVWQRNNWWMIESALASGARDLTLIALLNRELDAEGPGGTAHMVEQARKSGFHVVELDARLLLETV